jgi:hypothetical protein
MLDDTTTSSAKNNVFSNKNYSLILKTNTMKTYHNQLNTEEQTNDHSSDTLTSKEDSGGD